MGEMDLKALRELLGKATPGPWYTLDPPWLPSGTETSILAESPDPHVARFICDFDLWAIDEDERKSENPDADAALIVAAVNALPSLLDALESLTAKVEAMEWQPIETAPRDSSFVDLWLAPQDEQGRDLIPCRVPNCSWEERAWFDANGVRIWHRATHWRYPPEGPLPAPPRAKEEGE